MPLNPLGLGVNLNMIRVTSEGHILAAVLMHAEHKFLELNA